MAINWSNVTTPQELMLVPNTNTAGSFWTASLFIIWLVFMIPFSAYGFPTAFLASSFISLIIGIFFVFAGLINWIWVLFFLGCILFMFLYIVWSARDNY